MASRTATSATSGSTTGWSTEGSRRVDKRGVREWPLSMTSQSGMHYAMKQYAVPKKFIKCREDFAVWFKRIHLSGTVDVDFDGLKGHLLMGKPMKAWRANEQYNRYNDMPCFDETRVVLKDTLQPDYIHANYVAGYEREKAYILTQGPLPNTICEFWRMIWQEKVACIVMLTHTVERAKVKCERYTPTSNLADFQAGIFLVSLIQADKRSLCRSTLFKVTNLLTNESRYVAHVGYLKWPDRGVPCKVDAFRKFINLTKLININVARKNGFNLEGKFTRGPPLLIHCSAGVGRSAVFVVCDVVTEALNHRHFKDPLEVVRRMRQERFHAVHTKIQLLFIYDFVLSLAKHRRYRLLTATVADQSAVRA